MGTCCTTQKEENEFATGNMQGPNLQDHELLIIKCQAACRRYLGFKKVRQIKKSRAGMSVMDHDRASGNFVNPLVAEVERKLGEYNCGPAPVDKVVLEDRPEIVFETGAKYTGQWDKTTNRRHGKGC